ncbi:unnamed protein product [Peronospora farinosa]|uniref:Uncharacterized protein n=1 Tax=Peronospora farinosa TaxID=134698 RepID=A0ABN8BX59_9STRA|nr:unnamed protein product [Peronospora farinosa]
MVVVMLKRRASLAMMVKNVMIRWRWLIPTPSVTRSIWRRIRKEHHPTRPAPPTTLVGHRTGGNAGGGQNGGEAGGNTWTPPSNTGGNAPTTSPGNTNPGNVNENYNGMTSNIDFTAVQGEINPGTVVPQ